MWVANAQAISAGPAFLHTNRTYAGSPRLISILNGPLDCLEDGREDDSRPRSRALGAKGIDKRFVSQRSSAP